MGFTIEHKAINTISVYYDSKFEAEFRATAPDQYLYMDLWFKSTNYNSKGVAKEDWKGTLQSLTVKIK